MILHQNQYQTLIMLMLQFILLEPTLLGLIMFFHHLGLFQQIQYLTAPSFATIPQLDTDALSGDWVEEYYPYGWCDTPTHWIWTWN